MARSHRKPQKQQMIAKERINTLFSEAKKKTLTEPLLSKKYVTLARKIGMKYKVRIPPQFRLVYCRQCNSHFNSTNSRIRLRNGMVVAYCVSCKHFRRFRYLT